MAADPARLDGEILTLDERVARLELRVRELELRSAGAGEAFAVQEDPGPVLDASAAAQAPRGEAAEDELELEVGQSWFAKAGILVLALGAAFSLLLPYPGLPSAVPSAAGFAVTLLLFGIARAWRDSFEMVAGYLRAAALLLLYFSALRLMFFGDQHAIARDSAAAPLVLSLAAALNLLLALRWKSAWLSALVLPMIAASAVGIGGTWFLLASLLAMSALATVLAWRHGWRWLVAEATLLSSIAYLIWALNDPVLGRPMGFVSGPLAALWVLLAILALQALGNLLRPDRSREDSLGNLSALLNCGLGYAVYLAHSLGGFEASFVSLQVAASALFLALAVAFWVREQSRVSTFVYAMTGYMALSMAILQASGRPELFVWLSLQSVVVVATAILFRSRFIIVANFLIYLTVFLGYVIVSTSETGISIGFGVVALISARLLNWQKDRLELKTELMRNAYLLSAFVVFPYSLYHLVPAFYVSLAWVGLALFYYLMNAVVKSRKFRWMGHATLLLTTLYLAVIGTSKLEPAYRILSFMVLGSVLLSVSLLFTRLRRRQKAGAATTTAS